MSLRGAVCSPGSTGRGKGQADSGIRLIEIPSSRTLNLPGGYPATEHGTPMRELGEI